MEEEVTESSSKLGSRLGTKHAGGAQLSLAGGPNDGLPRSWRSAAIWSRFSGRSRAGKLSDQRA